MKDQAKRNFLMRLDALVDAGVPSITVQKWQAEFLEGLTEEAGIYRGVPLRIIEDKPGATQVTA